MNKRLFMPVIILILLSFGFQTNSYALESLSYLYAGNTTTYINNVERTGTNLKTVCPDYFEINSNGSLKSTIKVDPLFIESMHAKGIKVVPYLSNNWDRTLGRAALTNRSSLAKEIAQKVITLGCDGVNIDIQNLTEADRAAFSDFVKLLNTELPASKTLSVCVAANPWGVNIGWQGSYDYAALGSTSDQIFVMTYDESYTGGPPGAVASLPFVEKSISYALKYVPASKVVMGIPFYGRYWKQGSSEGGYAITVSDVERLLSTCKATTWYDSKAQCARATLTVSATDNAIIWGSNKLSVGTYDIWYENATSIEKKLSLVSKYSLLGAGSWALGQEPSHFWNNYSAWLIGTPFIDIENHWAQSYIIDIYQKGIITGLPGRRFDPQGSLTRAQAAVIFVKMLGLQNEAATGSFADTVGHWAQKEISIAKQYGIIKGYPGNLFKPDNKISREEFAVICDTVLFSADTIDFSQRIYSDVSPETNTWSNKSIIMLSTNNILTGYPDGTFGPRKTITRAETTKVISSMLKYPGGFTIGPNKVHQPTPVPPR